MPRARPIGGIGLPRMSELPQIVVEIIPSSDAPGGISGLGATAVAPAVANAIFAATGKRMRSLPFEPMSVA
jgi:isoquinoline 1-oxidoreductase beta subunit